MHKIDKDLTRVLLLQDRFGVRKSPHFDHDSNAVIGPTSCGPIVTQVVATTPPTISVTLNFERSEKK